MIKGEQEREEMINKMNWYYAKGDNEKRKIQSQENLINKLQNKINHEFRKNNGSVKEEGK